MVLLPLMHAIVPMREGASETAISSALGSRSLVALIPSDGYQAGDIGTLAFVENVVEAGEGRAAHLRGLWRIRVKEVAKSDAGERVTFERVEESRGGSPQAAEVVRKIHGQVDEFAKLMPMVPPEIISFVKGINSPGKLADVCGGSPMFTNQERLELLCMLDPEKRLARVSDRFDRDLEALRQAERAPLITECEACMDFADRVFETDPAAREEISAAFLDHLMNRHPAEVMGLVAEKYGPIFTRRRSLR